MGVNGKDDHGMGFASEDLKDCHGNKGDGYQRGIVPDDTSV